MYLGDNVVFGTCTYSECSAQIVLFLFLMLSASFSALIQSKRQPLPLKINNKKTEN